MYATHKIRTDQIQVSTSRRHPPLLIDEHAERVAARVACGGLTNEVAAQLRPLVRHRNELCAAVRAYLISKLRLAARRYIGCADQLNGFADQLAADLSEMFALKIEGTASQSHHSSSVRNAARATAAAQSRSRVRALTEKARISADAKHQPERIRQTPEAIS